MQRLMQIHQHSSKLSNDGVKAEIACVCCSYNSSQLVEYQLEEDREDDVQQEREGEVEEL